MKPHWRWQPLVQWWCSPDAMTPRVGMRSRASALDLASLASVAEFVARFVAAYPSLDLLVNNAGVMALPQRQTTVDGFEMQFGIHYLGHYSLTARLLPWLRRGHQPRVVNLSSLVHRWGAIDFDDLQA